MIGRWYMSLITGSALLSATATALATKVAGDYVIILHGSGRTDMSMKRMEWNLERNGFRVINETYPSWRRSIDYLANDFLPRLLERSVTDTSVRIHFVTHSLGGIVVRKYLANHHLENLGRVVMLGPPNQGSQIVDHLRSVPVLRNIMGTSRLSLGTRLEDVPKSLGPVQFPCGIIAGDQSMNPLLSWMLPGPNDGKVTLDSAKVEGMEDFLVVHFTHTWMMWHRQVVEQTISFLRDGRFNRSPLP